MAFDEIRLPEEIEKGAMGGPEFLTNVVTLVGGKEKRNSQWLYPRLSFDIGYGIDNINNPNSAVAALIPFFYARRGRGRGFRFKDWTDYSATGQSIGTGNGVSDTFQLVKTYTSGGQTLIRNILKPVAGTITIYVNAVEETGLTVDTTTGLVTFNSAPGVSDVITADFEFDVPVRFNTDKLNLTAITPTAIAANNDLNVIEIVEG